jgi:hypothetical protein
VDIISLSLGLEEPDPSIDAAIDMALKPKVKSERPRIVFAAAANGGAGQARAWPACKRGVICVNASDGHGGSSDWINPAAIPGEDNFMTLGINVESKWKKKLVSKSGTSFATPLAAALAANLLEFARIKVEMNEVQKDLLYSSKGLRTLLKRLSVETGGYRFLCPWKGFEGVGRLTATHLERQVMDVLDSD